MSSITLKNVPEDLFAVLKVRAGESHRSLSGEILFRLRQSLKEERGERGERIAVVRDEAAVQAGAWEDLRGAWKSEVPVEEEIESLYAARSPGRDVDVSL